MKELSTILKFLSRTILLITVIFCLIGSSFTSYAQNAKVDSLQMALSQSTLDSNKVNTLNLLAFELYAFNPRHTLELSLESIQLATKLKFTKGLAKANNVQGIGYWYVGEYDSAILFFDIAQGLYGGISDKKGQSDVLNNMGNVYRVQGNYPNAIENYHKSLRIDEERGDETGVAISHVNIGLIYKGQEDLIKALEHYKEALIIFNKTDNHFGQGVVLGNIGEVYLIQQEHDKALTHYGQAISSLTKIGAGCRIVFSQLGIGDVLKETNNIDSALVYYEKALNKAKECENPFVESQTLVGFGETYLMLNQLEKSQDAFKKAYDISTEKKFNKQRGISAKALSGLYERKGEHTLALEYYKIYHSCQDSLFNEDKIKEIARIDYEYQLDKEKHQALLEQERKEVLYQSELRKEQFFKELSLGIIILVIVIAFAYYQLYSKKKKNNVLLEEKNKLITKQHSEITKKAQALKTANNQLQELSSFKEGLTHMIVHDMKNSLNTIIGLSQKEKNNKKMNLISRAGQMMLNLVMNMLQAQKFEEAEVSLDLKEVKISTVLDEAQIQMELFAQMTGVKLSSILLVNPSLKVDIDLMSRVLVNLLTNAIKYSPAGSEVQIIIEASSENPKNVLIKVVDSGQGISSEKLPHIFDKYWQDSPRSSGKDASTGLGLAFCKLAVEAHKGSIIVLSKPNEGSTFIIDLPILKCNGPCPTLSNGISDNKQKISLVLKEDFEIIERYKNELKSVKVYQITVLKKVLESLEKESINSKWKDDLEAAILRGDEKRYIELVEA